MSEITVFTARRIRTMTPSAPLATAVAVRDGMILEAGTLETLRPWLDAHPHRIDDRFRDAGASVAGVSFDRADWPHGATGPAVPHGAVFSRPTSD